MADNGLMQTGWLETGGKKYYLNASGAMQAGWQNLAEAGITLTAPAP